jgi:polar amino acid transport system substrate-binding protein
MRKSFVRRVASSLLLFSAVIVGMTFFSARSGQAQTISEILAKKKIVVGVIVDFPPFGFLNDKQQPDGLDIEFSQMLAKALGVDLELVQVSGANRIPYLNSKKVDVVVADLGITPGRAKEVMFTIPYSGARALIYAPKDKKISDLADLSGLRVAVGRGSSNDIFLTERAPKDTTILRFDGDGVAAQALTQGQADALVESDTNVNALIARNPDDKDKLTEKFVLATQADALAVRKDAWELHQYLNTFIYYVKANGDLDALYRKWVKVPLPPLPTF